MVGSNSECVDKEEVKRKDVAQEIDGRAIVEALNQLRQTYDTNKEVNEIKRRRKDKVDLKRRVIGN